MAFGTQLLLGRNTVLTQVLVDFPSASPSPAHRHHQRRITAAHAEAPNSHNGMEYGVQRQNMPTEKYPQLAKYSYLFARN